MQPIYPAPPATSTRCPVIGGPGERPFERLSLPGSEDPFLPLSVISRYQRPTPAISRAAFDFGDGDHKPRPSRRTRRAATAPVGQLSRAGSRPRRLRWWHPALKGDGLLDEGRPAISLHRPAGGAGTTVLSYGTVAMNSSKALASGLRDRLDVNAPAQG
jgi:hypothetical protein